MKLILSIFLCFNFLIKVEQIFPQCSLQSEPTERTDRSLTVFSLTFEIRRWTNLPGTNKTARLHRNIAVFQLSINCCFQVETRSQQVLGYSIYQGQQRTKLELYVLDTFYSFYYFSTRPNAPIWCEYYRLSASYLLILTVLLVVYSE